MEQKKSIFDYYFIFFYYVTTFLFRILSAKKTAINLSNDSCLNSNRNTFQKALPIEPVP